MGHKKSTEYVHGYSQREAQRLQDQARSVQELLHHDSIFAPGSSVLEAGCGVGAQTVTLAKNNPDSSFTSIDISAESLEIAEEAVRRIGCSNVQFEQGDIFDLRYPNGSFDHIFICYVLEHLKDPIDALQRLKKLLSPNGSVTVVEGVRDEALKLELIDTDTWVKGMRDLQTIVESPEGTFCYTFFKAVGMKGDNAQPRD